VTLGAALSPLVVQMLSVGGDFSAFWHRGRWCAAMCS
jgi:hypothetical protein